MAEVIAVAGIVFGLFFFIVGMVGFIRFPDVYTRIHASGKLSTLGMLGLLVATAILQPDTTLRVLALGIFLVTTQPVASHIIASAAHRSGVRMAMGQRDDLDSAGQTAASPGTSAAPEPGAD